MTDCRGLSILSPSSQLTYGIKPLEDLIYNFLLQSNFPRASILMDSDLLETDVANSNGTLIPPSFVIVDPQTAEPLAVINAIDAQDDDILRTVSIQTRNYSAQLGGKSIQGFVIRVDFNGASELDQVQFYKIWPNKSLQQLTAKSFPDLDTLRVVKKLADAKNGDALEKELQPVAPITEAATPVTASKSQKMLLSYSRIGIYFPAILLLALVLLDAILMAWRGTPLLTLTQSVLIIGAALLFTVPAAIRYLRE